VVDLAFLACVLWATTKKRLSTFSRKKVHPPEKLLATPMGLHMLLCFVTSTIQRLLRLKFEIKFRTYTYTSS